MRNCLMALLLLLPQATDTNVRLALELSLPESGSARSLANDPVWKGYELSSRINPYYISGHFDGDRVLDHVIALTGAEDRKKVIGVMLSSQKRIVVKPEAPFTLDGWRSESAGTVWVQAGSPDRRQKLTNDGVVVISGGDQYMMFWSGNSWETALMRQD